MVPIAPPRRARLDRGERALVVAILVLMALASWLLDDILPEGPILWTLAPGRGLTLIDLPGVAMVLAACWLLRPRAWRQPRP